jgi:hypothetical protein
MSLTWQSHVAENGGWTSLAARCSQVKGPLLNKAGRFLLTAAVATGASDLIVLYFGSRNQSLSRRRHLPTCRKRGDLYTVGLCPLSQTLYLYAR